MPAVDGGTLDAPIGCSADEECDDGLFCNGPETCDEAGVCGAGVPVDCDDGVSCSSDACAEERRACGHAAPDVDGDGHGDASCLDASGVALGDDCADTDATAFPGRTEVCDARDDDCNPATIGFLDEDGDGASSSACCNGASCGDDCDDADNTRRPGVADGPPAACDSIDNDCDGMPDEGCPCVEGASRDCGTDPERMRIGTCRPGTQICVGGAWTEVCSGAIHPEEERCDGLDNDCDGDADEGVRRRYWRDADGDGFGTGTESTEACSPPAGYVALATDCDDADAGVSPAASDVCNGRDDDCDTSADPGCACTDGMTRPCGSGETGECARGTQRCISGIWAECVGAIEPRTETCNGLDDDCDGTADDGVQTTFHRDADGDGFGDRAATTLACALPAGHAAAGTDCDDTSGAVHPGAFERCNRIDDDCDGRVDTGCACTDGSTQPCGTTETGECTRGRELCVGGTWGGCVGAAEPDLETCNRLDDDCDTRTDEGTTASPCYVDGDGDGYGTGAVQAPCADRARPGGCPAGYAPAGGDCNDGASAVRPGAAETCNGRDDDCTGRPDDAAGMVCASGTSRSGSGAYGTCASVAGIYTCAADCRSELFTPSPPAERCDGADEDCDGAPDDGFACVLGSTANPCTTACGTPGARACNADCTLPAACGGTERCNACDDDLDGTRDDGFACEQGTTTPCLTTCGTSGTQRCRADCSGYEACRAAAEECNACDDDLDGAVDEGFECARSSTTACTTSCGTPGRLVCGIDCRYPDRICRADAETCNYCDDDGDGTHDDDAAAATEEDLLSDADTCAELALVSAACGSMFSGVRLTDDTPNDVSAAWVATPFTNGYGPFTVEMYLQVGRPLVGGDVGEGWALVVADGSGALVGPVSSAQGADAPLGVPRSRRGFAVEWSFGGMAGGPSNDLITLRVLDGSASGWIVDGPVDPGPTYWLDATTPVVRLQPLYVEYYPPSRSTGRPARIRVKLRPEHDFPILDWVDVDRRLPDWTPPQALSVGVTAGTSARSFTSSWFYESTARFGSRGICYHDGQPRLAAGSASGRLEVWHAARWGTVCADAFDAADANVACRAMGFASGTPLAASLVADGVDPTWLDELACAGTEATLRDCAFPGWGVEDCTHDEDVGVTCTR